VGPLEQWPRRSLHVTSSSLWLLDLPLVVVTLVHNSNTLAKIALKKGIIAIDRIPAAKMYRMKILQQQQPWCVWTRADAETCKKTLEGVGCC
jgi:hypothetical protein